MRKGNESLLKGHPHLREVLVWDKSRKYASLRELLAKIRANRYQAVVNLQRFAGTGFLTAFSGAAQRIGFSQNPFSLFFTYKVAHQIGGIHETERNLELLKPLGIPPGNLRPQLYPTPSDWEKVGPFQQKPYMCLAPASVWFTKQLPAHQWVKLIQQLPFEGDLYLIGGAGDYDLCEQIRQAAGREHVQNLCGKFNLLQSAALMAKAAFNYVNDSGPMHLASAVDAPVCAVYCSTVPDFGFGPLSGRSAVVEVAEPLDCRPCGLHGHRKCPQGHFRCGENITTQQLIRAWKTTVGTPEGAN